MPGGARWCLTTDRLPEKQLERNLNFCAHGSIDLVYLNRKNRIRKLRSEVPPWRAVGLLLYAFRARAFPGTIRNTKTEVGDCSTFRLLPQPVTVPKTPLPTPDEAQAVPGAELRPSLHRKPGTVCGNSRPITRRKR
jgi:hypothetical protein